MASWSPHEIIIHDAVRDGPVTQRVLSRCPDVSIRIVDSARSTEVIKASSVLSHAGDGILGKYLAGKGVLSVGPPGNAVVDGSPSRCHVLVAATSATSTITLCAGLC